MNGIGEVFTYRKQGLNVGNGVIDPSKVFYVEDPNGKIIVDGVRSTITREHTDPNTVVIGGKVYHTVTIGSRTWLVENLEYSDANIVVGNTEVSDTTPQANWFDNTQTNSYGLLYNYAAVSYIEENKASICPGWHVPTESELAELVTPGYEAIRSDSTWTNFPGDNSTGFSLLAAGQFTGSGFSNKGLSTGLLSISKSGALARRLNSVNRIHEISSTTTTSQLSLRLVKDN